MAIAHDAFSAPAQGTGNLSWSHVPVGTPRGVIVIILQSGNMNDNITGVTYGGVAMTEISPSPWLLDPSVHGNADADQAMYVYFLGSGIPTGTQTVVVSQNSTAASRRAGCSTVTADADTVIDRTAMGGGNGGALSATLGTSAETVAYGALLSSADNPGDVTPVGETTELLENDFGAAMGSWTRLTANPPAGFPRVGWNTLTGQAHFALGVAIKEASVPAILPRKGTTWPTTGDMYATGTIGQRPLPGDVPADFRYFATDDWGGSEYVSTGTAWVLLWSRNIKTANVWWASEVEFPNLDGNTDKFYELVWNGNHSVASGNILYVRVNGDSAANYQFYTHGVNQVSGDVNGGNGSQSEGMFLSDHAASTDAPSHAVLRIGAKSGRRRSSVVHDASGRADGTNEAQSRFGASVWRNTTDNITSLTVRSTPSGAISGEVVLRRWPT